ncbi:hypothetical protein PENSPDRAFT_693054 [Peniophora sp. CONT]|nr:hypothetical protein PENSPDRAFT_693054 [Peniophora sp. CONT]
MDQSSVFHHIPDCWTCAQPAQELQPRSESSDEPPIGKIRAVKASVFEPFEELLGIDLHLSPNFRPAVPLRVNKLPKNTQTILLLATFSPRFGKPGYVSLPSFMKFFAIKVVQSLEDGDGADASILDMLHTHTRPEWPAGAQQYLIALPLCIPCQLEGADTDSLMHLWQQNGSTFSLSDASSADPSDFKRLSIICEVLMEQYLDMKESDDALEDLVIEEIQAYLTYLKSLKNSGVEPASTASSHAEPASTTSPPRPLSPVTSSPPPASRQAPLASTAPAHTPPSFAAPPHLQPGTSSSRQGQPASTTSPHSPPAPEVPNVPAPAAASSLAAPGAAATVDSKKLSWADIAAGRR